MSIKSKLRHSRDNWKEKSIELGKNVRYQRKELIRVKNERDGYKQEARQAKIQLKQEIRENIPQVRDKENLVYLALQLFLVARIGFRAVSRVIKVLGSYLGVTKAPCTQTIINWITRLSLTRIQSSTQLVRPQFNDLPAKGR